MIPHHLNSLVLGVCAITFLAGAHPKDQHFLGYCFSSALFFSLSLLSLYFWALAYHKEQRKPKRNPYYLRAYLYKKVSTNNT